MTERSLLAVERDPGRYDLYDGRRTDESLLAEDRPLNALVAEHVDFLLHDTLRVSGREGTTTYRVLRYALPTSRGVVEAADRVGRGALVSVAYRLDPEDDGYVRGWFEGVRETLGEAVDLGALRTRVAIQRLDSAVRRFATDRDLILDPRRASAP